MLEGEEMMEVNKNYKLRRMTLWLIIFALILTGCGEGGEVDDEITALYIGQVVEESNPSSAVANEAFRVSLENYIGIPVIEIEDMSYLIGIEAMRAGDIDIMMTSAFNYLLAQDVADVELLVSVFNPDNANRTVFITHSDRDDINALEDLEGRTFAFVDAASTTGYLIPKYHLVTELNLDPSLIMSSGHFFDTTIFSGGHDRTVMGVNFQDFDGGAVLESQLDLIIESGLVSQEDIKIIDQTQDARLTNYMIRSELPEALINDIRSFFLNYSDEDYFKDFWGNQNTRFVDADEEGLNYIQSLKEVLENE